MPVLFKRPVLTDKDNNRKAEKEVEVEHHDDNNVEPLLSSPHLCNRDGDDCLLSTVVEDLQIPLPAPLKLQHSSVLTIVGNCDGIICLELFIGNIILCNPATKEFKLLPKFVLLLPNDDYDLTYEFRYYTMSLGFGYDPKGKDYKVVRWVIYEEACYWFGAEVYTIKSNSWREIKTGTRYNNMSYEGDRCFDQLAMYFNGICYWSLSRLILSFDMSKELFHDILFPDLPDGCWVVKFVMWKEFIAILTFSGEYGVSHSYDMWVMKDNLGDGKVSWTKHLTKGPVEGDKFPLLFWKGDNYLWFLTKVWSYITWTHNASIKGS